MQPNESYWGCQSEPCGWCDTAWPYPLTMVCETWRVARSSVYVLPARPPESDHRQPGKRGPKTALSDEELLQ